MIDNRNTAYHEAGHAVIGMGLGWQIDRISLSPGEVFFGDAEVRIGELIAVLAAGSAAEARFSETPPPTFAAWWGTNGEIDNRRAREQIVKAIAQPRGRDEAISAIWLGVFAALGQPDVWRVVSQLAEGLAIAGEFGGSQAKSIWLATPAAHPVVQNLPLVWESFGPSLNFMTPNQSGHRAPVSKAQREYQTLSGPKSGSEPMYGGVA